ncbi:MAG: NFACT RNA binding domain-containing protein [Parachlamydiaceae bacterium]
MEPIADPLSQQKQKLKQLLKRRLKAAQKYLEKCNQLIAEALHWQNWQHDAELLSAHHYLLKRGLSEVQLPDWEQEGSLVTIHLNPKWTPQEEISFRFKKSKKLKRSITPLMLEQNKADNTLQKIERQLFELEQVHSQEDLEGFKNLHVIENQKVHTKKECKEPPLPYHEFFSESGIPIWVGKNAKGNDQLTFRFANGNDEWFHAAEYPGSHVVLHHQGKGYDDPALQDALQLALFYSKGRSSGSGEIAVTKKKYVARLGKILGRVQISKHQAMLVSLDQKRIQNIRMRSKA